MNVSTNVIHYENSLLYEEHKYEEQNLTLEFLEKELCIVMKTYNMSKENGLRVIASLMTNIDSYNSMVAFDFLKSHNFNFDSEIVYFKNLVSYACRTRNLNVLQKLHENGANITYNSLYCLILGQNFEDFSDDFSDMLNFILKFITYNLNIFNTIYEGKLFSEIINYELLHENVKTL